MRLVSSFRVETSGLLPHFCPAHAKIELGRVLGEGMEVLVFKSEVVR